jgi:hypothetical protein
MFKQLEHNGIFYTERIGPRKRSFGASMGNCWWWGDADLAYVLNRK